MGSKQEIVDFRQATLSDIPLLREWDAHPHIKAAGIEDWDWEEMLSEFPDWREMLIARVDGQPIGFVQIIDPARESTHYWGDIEENLKAVDIWIGEPWAIGRGYGHEMMRQVLKRCFDNSQVKAVLIDPLTTNQRAHRFYEKLGFQFIENRQFGEDICRVYQLSRKDYLNELSSANAL